MRVFQGWSIYDFSESSLLSTVGEPKKPWGGRIMRDVSSYISKFAVEALHLAHYILSPGFHTWDIFRRFSSFCDFCDLCHTAWCESILVPMAQVSFSSFESEIWIISSWLSTACGAFSKNMILDHSSYFLVKLISQYHAYFWSSWSSGIRLTWAGGDDGRRPAHRRHGRNPTARLRTGGLRKLASSLGGAAFLRDFATFD